MNIWYNFSFLFSRRYSTIIGKYQKKKKKKKKKKAARTSLLHWRKKVLNIEGGGGSKLGIDRLTKGHEGAQCILKLLGALGPAAHATPVPTPMFYWSLAQTNAIFTFALAFYVYVDQWVDQFWSLPFSCGPLDKAWMKSLRTSVLSLSAGYNVPLKIPTGGISYQIAKMLHHWTKNSIITISSTANFSPFDSRRNGPIGQHVLTGWLLAVYSNLLLNLAFVDLATNSPFLGAFIKTDQCKRLLKTDKNKI